jgi:hypothetical protein
MFLASDGTGAPSKTWPRSDTLDVGVFDTVIAARTAVEKLTAAGFAADQITVVCSDHSKADLFREFKHQDPAGTHTAEAALGGSAIGATLGSLAIIASAAATGSVALWAAGPIFAWTGGVAGGLVGAMMSRGIERELANYYQQSVLDGEILIAADLGTSPQRQRQAADIFAECGAKPLELRKG